MARRAYQGNSRRKRYTVAWTGLSARKRDTQGPPVVHAATAPRVPRALRANNAGDQENGKTGKPCGCFGIR
ncbi:hypothetical protein [Burkholderia sp. BCC1993]|uniref:hypothetical protein n=1 Tax=Burkholderia sp. BCC1993 TaxID=2817444 RepID=UPI002AB1F6B3|nr:hypothetical protein [Burkholderia sp. BCC1993]